MHEVFKRVGISLWSWLCGAQEDKGAGSWVYQRQEDGNCVCNMSRSSTPHPCCSLRQLIFSLNSHCLQALPVLESTSLCRKPNSCSYLSGKLHDSGKTSSVDRAFSLKAFLLFCSWGSQEFHWTQILLKPITNICINNGRPWVCCLSFRLKFYQDRNLHWVTDMVTDKENRKLGLSSHPSALVMNMIALLTATQMRDFYILLLTGEDLWIKHTLRALARSDSELQLLWKEKLAADQSNPPHTLLQTLPFWGHFGRQKNCLTSRLIRSFQVDIAACDQVSVLNDLA